MILFHSQLPLAQGDVGDLPAPASYALLQPSAWLWHTTPNHTKRAKGMCEEAAQLTSEFDFLTFEKLFPALGM